MYTKRGALRIARPATVVGAGYWVWTALMSPSFLPRLNLSGKLTWWKRAVA